MEEARIISQWPAEAATRHCVVTDRWELADGCVYVQSIINSASRRPLAAKFGDMPMNCAIETASVKSMQKSRGGTLALRRI
jgi:hypothetical protein